MLDTLPRQTKTDEPTEPLSIRMPQSLLAELRELARKKDRTLTAQIVRMLRQGLERNED
jgi:predicted transcriptional regulator